MRDPHVQKMHFAVRFGEGVLYLDPEPLSFKNDLGTFDLVNGALTITPAEHFPDEEQARNAIEPFLRAWEIDADLTSISGRIRFEFDRVELIDRDPPPPRSPQVIQAISIQSSCSYAHPSRYVTFREYPQPPDAVAFSATLELQHAHWRWLKHHDGEEPLQAMAYFVLTLLEFTADKKPNAAQSPSAVNRAKKPSRKRRNAEEHFGIELDVLDTIGDLSSEKGGPDTARKATSGGQFQKLTEAEKQWLEVAIAKVIHRLGETKTVERPKITMNDLPSL